MKKGLAGIFFFFFALLCFSDTAFCASADTALALADTLPVKRVKEGVWIAEGDEWRYQLSEHEYLTRDWLYENNKWYYLDAEGYMSVGTKKIDGKYYYFLDNGEMSTGWAFDDDSSAWYCMNEDGTRKTGWYEAGDAWYWFDSKGVMYQDGFRMIGGHKYYFFENGQMAANKYVEMDYYGADGLKSRQYGITVQGKRKPSKEECEAITKAMEGIPGEWIEKCVNSGWEFMFYTDKDFLEAPATEYGIYYIHHKTDTNYKKIKFTRPEALIMAIGEYIAFETGNDKENNSFMADFSQYMARSTLVEPLPSYFDNKPSVWFGRLLEAYCDESVFYDIRKEAPDLADFFTRTCNINDKKQKPSLEELRDRFYEESEGAFHTEGPSTDPGLLNKKGPASGAA